MFSGSEVAFFSLSHNDFEKLENENKNSSKRILLLKDRPRSLLATILICNNFVNIAIVIISDFVIKNILPDTQFKIWATNAKSVLDFIPFFADTSIEGLAGNFRFLITVVGVTFLLVLFGEVAPKVYANLNNIRLARIFRSTINFHENS